MPPESDGPGAQNPPAPGAPTTPPVPSTPPAGPAPEATPTSSLPPQMPEIDDDTAWNGLPAWVKALRTENARHRVEKNALEQKVTAFEREKLSDLEKLQADVKQRDEQVIPGLRRENQQLKVQVAASKLGIVDPEAAALLLDWNALAAGASIDDALASLVAQRPWLKQPSAAPAAPVAPVAPVAAPPSSTSAATPPGGSTPATYTKSQLNAMSRAQMNEEWAQIQDAMKHGRVDYSR